jgi:uncharacterized protein YndB with AHSA1/START domain
MEKTIYTASTDRHSLLVEREFNGSPEQVWKAWTDPVLLAEWWAPLPYKAVTKSMDFRAGGRWHYYMLGPDGSQFWCMMEYHTVTPLQRFTGRDYFCDEEGKRNDELPGMDWDTVFHATATGTKVMVTVSFANKEDMEKIISMGFKEGFSAAHGNLDKLLGQS